MDRLLLKLVVTPVLISSASLAGRRWGETVSGWFIGLPLGSGPVCFFLALEQGSEFAAAAARGCVAGTAAESGFCLAYVWAARRAGWPMSIASGTVAFAAVAAALQVAAPPLALLAPLAYAALLAGLALMPRLVGRAAPLPAPPPWDLPARMALATALVLALTALGPLLGGRLSGLLATYPLFGAVLAGFAHRLSGPANAERVLRGMLIGLFGNTGFFQVIGLTIAGAGIAVAFAVATALALTVQGATLWLLRRPKLRR